MSWESDGGGTSAGGITRMVGSEEIFKKNSNKEKWVIS